MSQRLSLVRSTSDFPTLVLPPGLAFGPIPDAEVLAPVMLAAYQGTPDYEGEALSETASELQAIFAGKYGAIIPEATFAAYQGSSPVAAIITVTEDDIPLVALVFTLPAHAGKGIASALLAVTATALHDAGHPTISLAVNPKNMRAARLYQHLGFVNDGSQG